MYYLAPRNIIDMPAVMTTMIPRIIWYTEAAHCVKATNMRVEPQMSQQAGMARRTGLIFVFNFEAAAASPPGDNGVPSSTFFCGEPQIASLRKYTNKQVSSPTNMFAHWKYGCVKGYVFSSIFPSLS